MSDAYSQYLPTAEGEPEYLGTATYSPEDNKLRFTPYSRLSPEDYAKVKAAGFSWAPRQKLFVAGMWTPAREDLLNELCGEIGDEDTSLVERAEERAERFAGYKANRLRDAERAEDAVSAIADGIPLGQPILVGHHSERRARKDAERIESGMKKAVKMWQTAQYWKDRAAGALAHAKYKEDPRVRHRRIKGLESDIRVFTAKFTPDPKTPQIMQERWTANGYSEEKEPHVWTGGSRGGSWTAVAALPALEKYYTRWIEHTKLRLEYERAMLDEQGGLATAPDEYEVGGTVSACGIRATILKINRGASGEIVSVSTNSRTWPRVVGVEDIKEYEPPTEESAAAAKAKSKLPPLVNYDGEGFKHITKAEYDKYSKWQSAGTRVIPADGEYGAHRQRYGMGAGHTRNFYFITDIPIKERPRFEPEISAPQLPEVEREHGPMWKPDPEEQELQAKINAGKEAIKTGVTVVAAPQLFPTPRDLARRMAKEANAYGRILEPSAGTGNLIEAVWNHATAADNVREVVAIEQNPQLCRGLEEMRNRWIGATDDNFNIRCADFLEQTPEELGLFDAVIMNPPFAGGADIKHITHAAKFLKPGGILVAICAGGPRQKDALEPLSDLWEPLPAGTFESSGTGVNTVLMTIVKKPKPPTITEGGRVVGLTLADLREAREANEREHSDEPTQFIDRKGQNALLFVDLEPTPDPRGQYALLMM